MRQVIHELCQSSFVLQSNLDAIGVSGFQSDTRSQILDQVLGLSQAVARLEKELNNPDGTIVKLQGRIKSLKDQQAGEAIERGGKTFRDLGAVAVWVQMFKDKDLYHYCVDMVTFIMLSAEAYETIAEGMAMGAAAHKSEYTRLTKARISLSFGLTYPENLMKKQDKQKHVAIGGWFWTMPWSSFLAFKGTINNGAKDSITSFSLHKVSGMIQNAIDFTFPLTSQLLDHAVFTEQLLLSRAQAAEWIEALEPLYKILSLAGLSSEDAWERVLIFTKAIFDDV
jgi:hypothetical protein